MPILKLFQVQGAAMKVGRRTFDSSHHFYLRRQRWAMELVTGVGTKLYFVNRIIFTEKSIEPFLLYKTQIIDVPYA